MEIFFFKKIEIFQIQTFEIRVTNFFYRDLRISIHPNKASNDVTICKQRNVCFILVIPFVYENCLNKAKLYKVGLIRNKNMIWHEIRKNEDKNLHILHYSTK